jgi:hypothetical protein
MKITYQLLLKWANGGYMDALICPEELPDMLQRYGRPDSIVLTSYNDKDVPNPRHEYFLESPPA